MRPRCSGQTYAAALQGSRRFGGGTLYGVTRRLLGTRTLPRVPLWRENGWRQKTATLTTTQSSWSSSSASVCTDADDGGAKEGQLEGRDDAINLAAEYIRVGRVDEFADFAELNPSSTEDEDKEQEEDDVSARQEREEMIEQLKDRFFRFVDLPSGRKAMIFKYNDRFYASNALCPHRGAELYLGEVEEIRDDDMGIVWGRSLTCPLHNWVFNLEDGSCNMKRYVLDIYDVKQEAGEVFVFSQPKNMAALGKAKVGEQAKADLRESSGQGSPKERIVSNDTQRIEGSQRDDKKGTENPKAGAKPQGTVQFEFWRG